MGKRGLSTRDSLRFTKEAAGTERSETYTKTNWVECRRK
jgi:hypothetical protein